MILTLVDPLVLGLDRIETASFLRSNGTFPYLTGLPSFPDPQTLRRFLLQAPPRFWEQLHRVKDRRLQNFIPLPDHRSRLIFDLDRTVVTVFGHPDGAAVGYNPRYRGQRCYNPLLGIESNSSYLWDVERRTGNAGTWDGSIEWLDPCFTNVPPDVRELRVRADAGFGFNPVFEAFESRPPEYAVVARVTQAFRPRLPGLRQEPVNRDGEMADFEPRSHGGPQARRFVVARRFVSEQEAQPTLFSLGHYVYRAWVTNRSLTGISTMDAPPWNLAAANCARTAHCERFLPARSFSAHARDREIIRLAYNLVTAFPRQCLQKEWPSLTRSKLRSQLFLLPGELTRPPNRPGLRLRESSILQELADDLLTKISQANPLQL